MENFIFSFALSIILLNSFTLSLNSTTDKYALTSFKNSITSYPYAFNWPQNTSVCDWIGVSCGLKHGRVTALNLSGYGLVGTVAPHLGNLTFLRYLDTSSNSFAGILPFELSKLRRLKVMNMGMNSFTGEIPTWFGSLPQLEELYLFNNTFVGTIPSSLVNNSMLEILHLYRNQLSESIPHGIFYMSSLRDVRIRNNSLSGWLPNDMCNNMPNIKALVLSHNQIGGQIPPNIWKCKRLETLSLSYNNFNGNIPREIGRLRVLRELYLGYVNGFQGGIPIEIGNLSRLEILHIDHASLTGDIPSSIFNISSLRVLSLVYNNLSVNLPSWSEISQASEGLQWNSTAATWENILARLARLETRLVEHERRVAVTHSPLRPEPDPPDHVLASLGRLEARLDASERRAAFAQPPPRPDPDPPYADWQRGGEESGRQRAKHANTESYDQNLYRIALCGKYKERYGDYIYNLKQKKKKPAYFTDALWNDYSNVWKTPAHIESSKRSSENCKQGRETALGTHSNGCVSFAEAVEKMVKTEFSGLT
ncbi:hypothetical protein SASPL_149976 [Salvia splendens]|uniref:Leucine-rich repeat-containing N-terminal plant-type domain-containing protein n=1 Tax=Salvia splendens TaxID=180675 RepID=A0A8X8W5X4_SALSN|nr:hypothetical protein SASPL_149976 [Salvia splendens]